MQPVTILLSILCVALIGVVLYVLNRKPVQQTGNQNEAFTLLMNQMNELRNTVDDKLGKSSEIISNSLTRQFGESQRLIRDITREITEVKETGKKVENVADQLKSLQDILKNPKQRGVLGEYYLETLLQNTMPGGYQMQYKFKDGEIVDAVVQVKDKLIPIDSKFSLENYNRFIEEKNEEQKEKLYKTFLNDLKMRIQETAKYIRPAEGTLDFAFMFVPHEAIYYDLLVNKIGTIDEESQNLIQRAASKYHVIIVSPTSFLAYLQTVLQGLKAMQIEESASKIVTQVGELAKHLRVYEEFHSKMGNALGTTVNHYNASMKEFKKIDKDVVKITGQSIDIEVLAIDKPDVE